MRVFRIGESDLGPDIREIQVEGELDLAVADQLAEAIGRCDRDQVLIDLSGCEFIDSTGIAVIVRAHQEAVKTGRRVVIHSPAAQVLRVLEVTGLTENGLVFPSRDAATAASI
jgi:anti-sigma B factor antagonist